jgi:hypothetical protein
MLVGDVGSCTTLHVFQLVEGLFTKEITFFDFLDYNFPKSCVESKIMRNFAQ